MKYYLFIIGMGLILCSISLFIYRIRFIRNAYQVTGKVERVRKITNYEPEGKSVAKHIEISYINNEGKALRYIADNSLLVYFYSVGQPIKLAIHNNKVLVNSIFNICTAPIVLLVFGVMILYILSIIS